MIYVIKKIVYLLCLRDFRKIKYQEVEGVE